MVDGVVDGHGVDGVVGHTNILDYSGHISFFVSI